MKAHGIIGFDWHSLNSWNRMKAICSLWIVGMICKTTKFSFITFRRILLAATICATFLPAQAATPTLNLAEICAKNPNDPRCGKSGQSSMSIGSVPGKASSGKVIIKPGGAYTKSLPNSGTNTNRGLSTFGYGYSSGLFGKQNSVQITSGFNNSVKATRVFAGPKQYPPKGYAAYGILAFKSQASEFDKDRHKVICSAYVNAVPHESESNVESRHQMVTIWPVKSVSTATAINKKPRNEVCDIAIDEYGLTVALQAIKSAEKTGLEFNSNGPYLLAWSPTNTIGTENAVILWADLSSINTYDQALKVMQGWVHDIESDPSLWKDGWDLESFKMVIQKWLDKHGPDFVKLFGLNT